MSDIDKLLDKMREQWSTPQTNDDLERLVRALNQDLHDRSRYGLTSDTLKAELATKYGVEQ